jgi:hypothetical protein
VLFNYLSLAISFQDENRVAATRAGECINAPVAIKVSSADKINRLGRREYTPFGKETCVGEAACRLSLLRFTTVRIDRIDVAAMQSDHATAWRRISDDEIGHAIAVEITGGERSRFYLVRSELANQVG